MVSTTLLSPALLKHGGNLNQAAKQYNLQLANWLDLSTGINPDCYPIPSIAENIWQRLPEADDGLIEAVQAYYNAPHVLATAGSQAAIQTLPMLFLRKLGKPCHVAMPRTMYAEHAQHWLIHGHTVHYFEGSPDAALLEKVSVIVVCNPSNPTAQLVKPEVLLAWHTQLVQKGGWLIVDEAFMDCTPEFSLAKFSYLPNLIILRSLGKFFGLAGARVGFVLAEEALLNSLENSLGPWPIAGPARYIAIHALQNTAWQSAARQNLITQSERLNTLLSQYNLKPQGSTALFQWLPNDNAQAIHKQLAKQGIWTRLFTDWNAVRFGLPPENGWTRLEAALVNLNR